MSTCDVCGSKLGVMSKFRYSGGYICKGCYKKASRQFTETITQKNLSEIRQLCKDSGNIEQEQNFEITGRIGNYLLVDEKNQKICILNNRITGKQVSEPEFYSVKDIKTCEISCIPEISKEELDKKVQQKEDGVVNSLKVCIRFCNELKPVEIILISSGARIKSYAFRQSYNFAKRIEEEVNKMRTYSFRKGEV